MKTFDEEKKLPASHYDMDETIIMPAPKKLLKILSKTN
jgi:hypothetical protein